MFLNEIGVVASVPKMGELPYKGLVRERMWRGYSLRQMIEDWEDLRQSDIEESHPWHIFIELLHQ